MPYPNKLKGKEQQVLDLHKSGMSEYKIAVVMEVYPNSIRQMLKRLHAAPRPPATEATQR